MASSALFQALLLASSLGWTGVFAYETTGNSTSSGAGEQTFQAPQVGVSQTSLALPTSTSQHPIALTPVTGQSDTALDLPGTSTSSTPPIAYSPATGHSDTSLVVPTTSSTLVVAPYPVVGHTEDSLDVPGATTTSETTRTFRSPVTQHSQTSLDIPGDHGGHHGGSTTTPSIAESPATGHSVTSLDVPPTVTPLAPIVATAKSQTKLIIPTRPADGGLIATISLPPEHGNGPLPSHNQHNGRPGQEVNPGDIIASIAHDHGEEWNGGDDTEIPTNDIVPGVSAATIDGTTYSLAPSGTGLYVNGHATTLSGPSATDSVAMAVMSVLGGGEGEETSSEGSSTLATTTSSTGTSSSEPSSSGSSSAEAAQQTDNAAALVLPGIGLGAVGLLMALL